MIRWSRIRVRVDYQEVHCHERSGGWRRTSSTKSVDSERAQYVLSNCLMTGLRLRESGSGRRGGEIKSEIVWNQPC